LRNAHCAHYRVVAEDAAEVIRVRENVLLERQEHPGGIHEINSGDFVSMAMFCARITFFAVIGKNAPAFTVASLQ